MSTLHTINRSPQSSLLQSCLNVAKEDDGILFIEDGTYYCASPSELSAIASDISTFSLREDMIARATLAKVDDSVELIDMARFVELCCEYDKIVSWF